MKALCYNCGTDKSKHHWMSMQCPKKGVIKSPHLFLEWANTYFEDAEQKKMQETYPDLPEALKVARRVIERLSHEYNRDLHRRSSYTFGEHEIIENAIKVNELT